MKQYSWEELLREEYAAKLLKYSKIPLRVAANGSAGFPIMASLWFEFDNGRILCATQPDAVIVKCLSEDPRCAFEISTNIPPYTGIRGKAIARINPNGSDLLKSLIPRYLERPDEQFREWLLKAGSDDVVLELEPKVFHSWNFSSRMNNSR